MAIAPAAAPPVPADPMMPAGDDAALADDMSMEEGPAGRVIATIMQNDDGTWSLQTGDEPEPMPEGDAPAEAMEPAPAQTFDNKGRLMKAILDLLDESEGGGEAEGFASAFKGEAAGPEA